MKRLLVWALWLATGMCLAGESGDVLAARIISGSVNFGHVVGIAGARLPDGTLVPLSAVDNEVLSVADRADKELRNFMLKDAPEKMRIWYALHILSDKMKRATSPEESKDILRMQLLLGARLQQLAESKYDTP